MSRKMLWGSVAALLVALLIPLAAVSAQPEPFVDIVSVGGECTPGQRVTYTLSYNFPGGVIEAYRIYTLVLNEDTGAVDEVDLIISGGGGGTETGYSGVDVPDGTELGHTLTIYIELWAYFSSGDPIVVSQDDFSWICGNDVVEAVGLPGCDVTIPIPSDAVVGAFVADAPLFYAPRSLTFPLVTIDAGNTAWVLGKDTSGDYYKIIWVCQHLWVEVSTMGPNYDQVWNGRPLPADTVD